MSDAQVSSKVMRQSGLVASMLEGEELVDTTEKIPLPAVGDSYFAKVRRNLLEGRVYPTVVLIRCGSGGGVSEKEPRRTD